MSSQRSQSNRPQSIGSQATHSQQLPQQSPQQSPQHQVISSHSRSIPSRSQHQPYRLVASSAPFVQRRPTQSLLSFPSFREDLTSIFSTLVDLPADSPAEKRDAYEMCKVLLELCTVWLHSCTKY